MSEPHAHPSLSARPRWHAVGYWLTAAWLVLVLVVTGGERAHPLMEAIFLVPLAGWIAAVAVDRRRRRARAR